jgi:hypothetical protein
MAEDRLLDSKALLDATRWAAAYYLAGYAVECGLKACVLALVEKTGVIFDDPKYSEKIRTHKLPELLKHADLEPQFGVARGSNPALDVNWGLVSGWSEESRYKPHSQQEAEQIYEAITNSPSGVMQWIRQHW